MKNIKDLFMLDPGVVFLNHGSFGACPRKVFDVYQNWQRELELQPVEFLSRRSIELLASARAELADYLGVSDDEVVYFTNPTTAINMVARSLISNQEYPLQAGDEVLTTDHEYGAMDRTWQYICRKNGVRYVKVAIPLPVCDQTEFVEKFWSGVNARTRVIFISHLTSPTALIFPVKEICRRAREAGILSIVDGAHAIGQMRLNLKDIGADIYTGACHKWLMAPKGSAFLYARSEIQPWLEPLVVSWGYESEYPSGSQYVDYHEWQGTRDLAAFLSVPSAIEFQDQQNWRQVRSQCHELAVETRDQLNEMLQQEPICPLSPNSGSIRSGEAWFLQMFTIRLPDHVDIIKLKENLYDRYRIEVPTYTWNNHNLMRVSIQGYNTRGDTALLVDALREYLG